MVLRRGNNGLISFDYEGWELQELPEGTQVYLNKASVYGNIGCLHAGKCRYSGPEELRKEYWWQSVPIVLVPILWNSERENPGQIGFCKTCMIVKV
jgi:hypothetical protein